MTIRFWKNIRIGNKDATDEQVIAAAELANVDEFAEKLPDGWHTNIGKMAVNFPAESASVSLLPVHF